MRRSLLLAAVLALGSVSAARAQGWIDIERRPNVVRNGAVFRVSSSVRTRIEGRVATVEVQEEFRNTGGGIAEGTYIYPLPGEAVFQNFSLWMGENEIRGEMMNAEQARGIYEEIVRRLRDPALLTMEGHGLVRARIFPIQPGETRRVVLRYTQLLQREGDALRLRYAIGERGPLANGALNQPPGASDRFRFRVTLPNAESYGTPYSPTHRITTRREGETLEVSLDSTASGDVELYLPLRRGLVGTSLSAYAPGGEDGYFMLLISPAQADEATPMPKDLTLVVDVSGSMSGDKIEQAKSALRQALGTLGQDDRFRLISFSNRVTNFHDGYTAATADNLADARRWVDGLVADGGTNIAGALDAALGGSAVAEERLPIVVFMTDGIPSVGEQRPEQIAQEAGAHIGRARVFTFGVGSDVNTYLLDRLAQEGRGTSQYVAQDASVEQAIGSLMNKVRHPALVNLRIDEDAPVELAQSYPSRLPDVFFGEELVVFGRYHGTGSGRITITGQRNGRTERFTTDAVFPASATDNAFIPRLWASRRIGELTRQVRIEGASQSLVGEIRDLGLRYGILTEYTSYIVQEPNAVANRPTADQLMRTAQPASAPSAQSGAGAVARARTSSALMGAGNLAAAEQASSGYGMGDVAHGPSMASKRIGGRLFVQRDSVWTDAGHQGSLRVFDIAPFSEAYFQLVRALPEIAPFLKAGDQVLVAGRRASIRITPQGASTWRSGELDAAVRAYRGA